MTRMDEMIGAVAAALDEAVAKWQPGDEYRIKEAAARAAIDALQPFVKIRETDLGCSPHPNSP